MKYLAIDTSNAHLTVIVEKDGKSESVFNRDCGVNHSVEIMTSIESCLERAKLSIKDLDFIAVVVGAGSFTGIRIGIATAKALSFSHNIPLLSITSFDTIAYNMKSGRVLAVISAKHDCYYVCGYDNGKVVFNPSFIDKKTLLDLSNDYQILSFEELDGIASLVVSVKDGLINAIDENHKKATLNYDEILPLYVRKSQAEEGR